MLRQIRELLAAGPDAGHVTGQHLISKVVLKRFAAPSGPYQGLVCPFRLEYPLARHRLVGPDGCAKVDDFVAWASASAEKLWKETEDRLPGALAAMDAGTLLGNEGHMSVIKVTGHGQMRFRGHGDLAFPACAQVMQAEFPPLAGWPLGRASA